MFNRYPIDNDYIAAELSLIPLNPTGAFDGYLKVHNGSSFIVRNKIKYHNGSSFTTKPLKVVDPLNLTQWLLIDTSGV